MRVKKNRLQTDLENQPSGVTKNGAILMEFMPVFTSDETCRTYSVPACMKIAPLCENVLLSFLLGIIRSFLTAIFQQQHHSSSLE